MRSGTHANDAGFLVGLWYVYLGRSTALWKASGDTVSLLDGSGNLVAIVYVLRTGVRRRVRFFMLYLSNIRL